MKTYKILLESLKQNQKEEVDSWIHDPDTIGKLSDHIWNKDHPDIEKIDEDTIRIPYEQKNVKIFTHPEVQKYIRDQGHKLHEDDHTYSYVRDPKKENKWNLIKTGKLLKDRPDLQDLHRDTLNTALNNNDGYEIIIKRPKTKIGKYDTAGMSTDKHWTSCMRMADSETGDYGGYNQFHLMDDIQYGTHVAYLVKKGTTKPDTELDKKNVVGRIAIKPFVSYDNNSKSTETILYPDREYPSKDKTSSFHNSVTRFFGNYGGYKDNTVYHLHHRLYNDGTDTYHHINEDELTHDTDKGILYHVLPNTINTETLDKFKNHPDHNVRYSVTRNPNTLPDTLHDMRHDKADDIRSSIAKHPNTRSDTLHELSKDDQCEIRKFVATNKNTRPETLHILANDSDIGVRNRALENIKTTDETRLEAFNKIHKKYEDDFKSSYPIKSINSEDIDTITAIAKHANKDLLHKILYSGVNKDRFYGNTDPTKLSPYLKHDRIVNNITANPHLSHFDISKIFHNINLSLKAESNINAHPNTPSNILHHYYDNEWDSNVKIQIASHPNFNLKEMPEFKNYRQPNTLDTNRDEEHWDTHPITRRWRNESIENIDE